MVYCWAVIAVYIAVTNIIASFLDFFQSLVRNENGSNF